MSTTTTSEQIRPLSKRRYDWPILIFFLLNLCLITYIVDLEQLVLQRHFIKRRDLVFENSE